MSTTRYAVILGVDLDRERQAALELGPFPTSTDALTAAADAIGRTPRAVAHKHAGKATPYYETIAGHLPIAGFTLERFTDQYGTDDWRIEPAAVRVPTEPELCSWCDEPAVVELGTTEAACDTHRIENYVPPVTRSER